MICMPRAILVFCFLAFCLRADAPNTPEPPKTDIPYLLMAQDLVSTDAAEAQADVRNAGEEERRDHLLRAGRACDRANAARQPHLRIEGRYAGG